MSEIYITILAAQMLAVSSHLALTCAGLMGVHTQACMYMSKQHNKTVHTVP